MILDRVPLRQAQAFGLTTINGLPAHVLIVHAVVVLVPLSALLLVVTAVSGSWARRFGVVTPLVAVAALVSTLAAMNAGGWLQNHVPNTALVRRHTAMAGELWPFVAAVALLAVLGWWRTRRSPGTDSARSSAWLGSRTGAAFALVSIVVSVAMLVLVARIGESGARAAWHGHFTQATTTGQP